MITKLKCFFGKHRIIETDTHLYGHTVYICVSCGKRFVITRK